MTEHFVQHQLSCGDWVRTKFKCEAPETALCRTVCVTCESEDKECCQCEYVDPPRTPDLKNGINCMLVDWLDESPEECYAGDEDTPVRGPDWQPITITWNGDCYEWDYEPPPVRVERISDLTHEQYQALTEEEKQARLKQQQAYSDQYGPGEYPVREQLNGEYQRGADNGRAAGYNPPGIYC